RASRDERRACARQRVLTRYPPLHACTVVPSTASCAHARTCACNTIVKRATPRTEATTSSSRLPSRVCAMSKCLTYRRKCVQLLGTRTHSEASVNKSELVDSIAEGAGLSKADAERALNSLIDAVQTAVANDDKVTLPGFGSFSRSSRAARTGRNPRTGEPVQIAASKGVKFSAGAAFKSAVNKQ